MPKSFERIAIDAKSFERIAIFRKISACISFEIFRNKFRNISKYVAKYCEIGQIKTMQPCTTPVSNYPLSGVAGGNISHIITINDIHIHIIMVLLFFDRFHRFSHMFAIQYKILYFFYLLLYVIF